MQRSAGFTLIELLIVVLIVGVISSLAAYSMQIVSEQNQNSLMNQWENQVKSVKNKAKMYNFRMRIGLKTNPKSNQQEIFTQYWTNKNQQNNEKNYDVDYNLINTNPSQNWSWQDDLELEDMTFDDDDLVLMDEKFISIFPNGFVSDGSICFNGECWENE